MKFFSKGHCWEWRCALCFYQFNSVFLVISDDIATVVGLTCTDCNFGLQVFDVRSDSKI